MAIDFNQTPYFDDYDPSKGFYKILFRPGFAVQTRELNQIQTILQKQVERFGQHIFREGSIVLDGQFDTQLNVDYVKLNIEGFESTNFSDYVGTIVNGQSSGLRAFIVQTELDENDGTQVLMVRYLNSNNEDESVFRDNENIIFGDTGLVLPTITEDATGKGSVFSIEEGVIFTQGYFVKFPRQSIIIDPYSTEPSVSVGFIVDEPSIVTAIEDQSLLDNAQGTFNFAAPGADRFTLSMKLARLNPEEIVEDTNFILLIDLKNGIVEEAKERTQYARLYEEIAKRTYDESGDYVVTGMTIRTREALDTGLNEGLDSAGDPNKISIDVEPGLAYVKGYEVNNLVTQHILVDRGIDFKYVDNSILNARTGGFVTVNEIVGSLDIDIGTVVDLYDTLEERVTNETNVTSSPSGNKIGEARIKTSVYNSGELGTPNGSLRIYLFDIRMDAGEVISNVKAISLPNKFFGDVSVGLSDTIENTLIYPVGLSNVRKIRKANDIESDTSYSYSTMITNASIAQNTKTINITSSVPLNYGLGTLGAAEKQSIFVSLNNAVGSFPAGAHLNINDPSVVVTVTSSTTFTISLGNTWTTVGSPISVTVTYQARESVVLETQKELVPNVYIKINYDGSNPPASLTAPINLGFPDVWKVKEVRRKNGSDFTDENDGEDITSSFRLDNGQKDNFYDHGKLVPIGNVINANDWLLIKLDIFRANSHSYFSVDSYPINDTEITDTSIFTYEIPKYVTTSGTEFSLRDCLDFRPHKQASAAYSATVAGATVNPVVTNTFVLNNSTNKLLIPIPSSPVVFDYSYYMARNDVLTVDQNGVFSTVRGTPSLSPITPQVSENVMPIANILIPPYPSISQTFARILNLKSDFVTHKRIANRRFTMRDISVLKNRIENLEYYNTLNLLEKNTADLLILDESGNNRFKNGFFVDGFLDHSLGDTTNDDYNIAIDRIEQVARPVFDLDSFSYEYDTSGQLQKTGELLHLPLDTTTPEVVLIDQPRATTIRNVEQSVYRFVGNLQLSPDNDTWVDETVVDKTVEFGADLPNEKIISTEYGSWQTHILGYEAYDRRFRDRSGNINPSLQVGGTFSSYAAAQAAAVNSNLSGSGNRRGLVATIQQDSRTGIETTVTTEKEVQNLGNFVTDVSVIPYIRPQAVEFYATGIKPNTRHWLFFDGEDVTNYVRQFVDVDEADLFTAPESPIRSNEFGEIRGVLFLPVDGKRFRVGSKEIKLIDNPTISNDNISSLAENYFLASGLNVQKQNTILSTKNQIVTQREFTETRRSVRKVDVIGPSCIAYTFNVPAPDGEEGAFLTSIDLFFAEFHPDLGFRVQIRELNSAGNITQNVLPYSEVWVPRKVSDGSGGKIDNPNLQTSGDSSVPTNIKFAAPVFVYNNTNYAIVVSAENINPDTYLWISRLGETDVLTQQPVTSRPLTGAVFTTNNGVNWDIVPQADMKVKLYRAKFQTGTDRVGIIKNKPYEFLQLTNVASTYKTFGEEIVGSERLNLIINSGSASVGNDVIGQTSGASGTVISVTGSTVFTTGFNFIDGEDVVFEDNGTEVGEATITSIVRGTGKLKKYTPESEFMQLSDSNGRFFAGALVRGVISEIESTIDTIQSYPYSATIIKPDFINFNNTKIEFSKRGRRTSDSSLVPYIEGSPDNTTEFENELHVLSRTTERNLFGTTGYSSNAQITMNTDSEYLSPIVDISRAHAVHIHNIINNDISGETESSGGNLINKYISKTVTLEDGQDAEDLIVYLTAYRPPSLVPGAENDIKVWMKVRNGEDPETLDDKPWYEMVKSNNNFSSIGNQFDFIDLEFTPPPELLDVNEIIEYEVDIDGDPVLLKTYKQYAIKIGIVGGNSAIVPKVADLRAIALQK